MIPASVTTAIQGGTIVSKARSYQLVISRTVLQTEFRVTLEHVTTGQQLARISNDTGLQEDVDLLPLPPAKFQPRLCSGIVRSCRRARLPHARAHSRSPTTDLGFSWNNRQTTVSPAGSGRIRGSWQKTAGRWICGGSVARISRRTDSAVSEQRRGDWSELFSGKRVWRPNLGDFAATRRKLTLRAHYRFPT